MKAKRAFTCDFMPLFRRILLPMLASSWPPSCPIKDWSECCCFVITRRTQKGCTRRGMESNHNIGASSNMGIKIGEKGPSDMLKSWGMTKTRNCPLRASLESGAMLVPVVELGVAMILAQIAVPI